MDPCLELCSWGTEEEGVSRRKLSIPDLIGAGQILKKISLEVGAMRHHNQTSLLPQEVQAPVPEMQQPKFTPVLRDGE